MSKSPGHSSADGAVPERNSDPQFQAEIQRLFKITLYSRWLVVGGLWLTVGSLSLWSLRESIQLWFEYFTWAAIRYAFAFNRLAAVGVGLCMGTTFAVLLWQSRVILWGIPDPEYQRLSQQVMRIRVQGSTHPLWNRVCGKKDMSHTMGQGQNNQH